MATAVLTTGAAKKTAAAKVRVPCDFGDLPALIAGYTIVDKSVTCSGSGAPTVSGVQVDYTLDGVAYQISALFDGGTPGSYDVVFSVTLNDPDATVVTCTGVLTVL